jgi:hypothetical protein
MISQKKPPQTNDEKKQKNNANSKKNLKEQLAPQMPAPKKPQTLKKQTDNEQYAISSQTRSKS